MKYILPLLLFVSAAIAQPFPARPGPVIISKPGGGVTMADVTNVVLAIAVNPTNGVNSTTVTQIVNAVAGGVLNSNSIYAQIATNAMRATNVYYGGTVNTTNILTTVANAAMTNASVFMGYGGIQLAAAWALQEGSGIPNSNHLGSKISWYQTGWDGTPESPTQYPVTVPQAFIDVRRNWGGGPLNTDNDRPTLHIATKGDIRIEPMYSHLSQPNPIEWFGQQYLSLGNEDVGNKMYINYLNGSVRSYPGSGTPNERYAASTVLPWAKGYGLPVNFLTVGMANNVEYHSRPTIWAHSGDTNAADKTMGELWFCSRGPTLDIWQPTADVYQNAWDMALPVFKMKTNHTEFLLEGIKTPTIRTPDSEVELQVDFQATNTSNVNLNLTHANTNMFTMMFVVNESDFGIENGLYFLNASQEKYFFINQTNGSIGWTGIASGDGTGITNLTYNFKTNASNLGTVTVGQTMYTNITGNVTIGGFSGVTAGYNQWAKLIATNSTSTDYKITLPASITTSTNAFVVGQDIWVTNKSKVHIMFDIGPDTNAAALRFSR